MSDRPLIALIRHGAYHQKANTPSAMQPFPLTKEGEEEVVAQAKKFAVELNENGWRLSSHVHSSNLLRAWQTAKIYIETLADYFDKPAEHIETASLCERSVGSVANLTVLEIEQILENDPRYAAAPRNWKSNSDYCLPFPGAESLMQAGERVSNYVLSNLKTQSNNHVQLFIGHGASIRHAACHLNVMQICDVSTLSMYHAHPVVLQCVGNKWQHIAGKWKIRKPGGEPID